MQSTGKCGIKKRESYKKGKVRSGASAINWEMRHQISALSFPRAAPEMDSWNLEFSKYFDQDEDNDGDSASKNSEKMLSPFTM